MYNNISEEAKNKFDSNAITTTGRLRFPSILIDNLPLIIDENNLVSIKLKDNCYIDGKIIGNCIAKDVEIELINNNYDFQDKEFSLELGILISENNYEYVPYGNFIIDTVEDLKSNNKYRIKAMDYMANKLNEIFVDNNTYPMTLKSFFEAFSTQYNIQYEEQILPNENFIINDKPFFDNMSGRIVLSRICEMFGKFSKFNRYNRLQFYLSNTTNTKINRSNMNTDLEIDKLYGEINVVVLRLGQVEGENITLRDEESISKYGENILEITDNPFIYTQELRQKAIQEIFDNVKGFKYIPTKFTWTSKFYLDCGDFIQVQNMKTDDYVDSIILNQYIEIPSLRKSKCENLALTKTAVKNQVTPDIIVAQRNTEIIVDKQNQKITNVIDVQTQQSNNISKIEQEVKSINSSVKMIGGNNKQKNSVGAFGTKDYEQSEVGKILTLETEELKRTTQSGRAIIINEKKWFKFKSDNLIIGSEYSLSFKYSNTEFNNAIIKLINNNEFILIDTTEIKKLQKFEYHFKANTESIELLVQTSDYEMLITDYYLQTGNITTEWQPYPRRSTRYYIRNLL